MRWHCEESRPCLDGGRARIKIDEGRRGNVMAWNSLVSATLAKIPGEVWGALIAIGGVLLATLNSNRQGARQRLFEMRRSVYLEGADAIARASALVGRLTDLKLDTGEVARVMNETAAGLARIHVVGKLQTVSAVMDFQAAFVGTIGRLCLERAPLTNRESTLDGLKQEVVRLNAER
jgi:hypothetical protein